MTTEVLKENIDYDFINAHLEYGQRQAIAEKFQLNRSTAYKYLKGIGYHKKFLEACYAAAIENANKWLALKEQTRILKERLSA